MFNIDWKSWLRLLTPNQKLAARRSRKKPSYRPQMEALENRWVPSATASVSGFAFLDLTGNGAAAGNPGESGVTMLLFQDHNHNGRLDGGDRFVASQKTAADGSYAFTNLKSGAYFVYEIAPDGSVVTEPLTTSTYAVNLAEGQAVSGDNFTNFHKPRTNDITKISYRITDPTLGVYTVDDLEGHVHQGDTVTANFTVKSGHTATLSLVSYDAPGPKFRANDASKDMVADYQTATFTAGPHSLTVHIPNDFFEVDFVVGSPITTFGPAGSKVFYSKEGRLLESANGGKQLFVASSLSGYAYVDANANGARDAGEVPLAHVSVTLTGTNDLGKSVSFTTTTDANGLYHFEGLRQGTYTIADIAPAGYADEVSTVAGSLGGTLTTAGQVLQIVVANGQNGINYNMPEVAKVVAKTYSIGGTLHFFPGEPATPIVLTDTTTGATTTLMLSATGPYLFTGLAAGDSYTVAVFPSSPYVAEVTSTVKASYTITNLSSDVTGDNFFIGIGGG